MDITRFAIAVILTVGSALAVPATAVACDCNQSRIDPNYRGLIIHGQVITIDRLQGTNTLMVVADDDISPKDRERRIEHVNALKITLRWQMPMLKGDAIFDALRSDPRFPALLDRLGLPR